MTGSELICCLGVICLLSGIGCVLYARVLCVRMFCEFENDNSAKQDDFQNQIKQEIDSFKKENETLKEQIQQMANLQRNKQQVINNLIQVITNFQENDVYSEGDTQVEDEFNADDFVVYKYKVQNVDVDDSNQKTDDSLNNA